MFALVAAFAGGYAGLARTAISVTFAITICVVSALLAARLALGATRSTELASWIALAVSIAGLVFSVAVATMGSYEPESACRLRLPTIRVERLISSVIVLESWRLKAPQPSIAPSRRLVLRKPIVGLDDLLALPSEGLGLSPRVGTRERRVTQSQATGIHAPHLDLIASRWWSTLEANRINWTLFDQRLGQLSLRSGKLMIDDLVTSEAAELMDLSPRKC